LSIKRIVNVRNTKAFDIYGGRPGILGNPFSIGEHGDRNQCIELFKVYAARRVKIDKEFRAKIMECDGKIVGCFCAPDPCHVEVIDQIITAIKDGKL
jgi:hypothetical protein